ncbi:ABC transporter ATP-binding protein [Blastococcus capsensis]|uniref:ABC transporter ATP-binding protein n=1 Tax=Blastococcus capsensis TaxID=1564163 RepID=UPI00253FD60C|nr:ABC transporter ATP-binding protein [Blastococcus capsensis]MDK3256910.1 ABC transporter ATP-binding protein [Blastococcus capsensis]
MSIAAELPVPPATPDPVDPLLEVRDLHTWFDTPRGMVRAVDGVSFTLRRGASIGIVGESGSGKTVLSRSIMNLLPKKAAVPASGEVLFEGRDLRPMSSKQMRSYWGPQMAMVFQDPMTSLNGVVKIGRQITEGLRQHLDLSRQDADAEAVRLLTSVGIPAPERRLGEYPHQLSGGMRQRVTIAIALACGPKLLMADEPTTALDVTVQAQILDLLARQQAERSMGMVLVTHDLGVVANRTDDIAVMYAGQIVEKASTRTLFRRMRHPYTEALMRCIPRVENPSHTRLDAIPGRPPDLAALPVGCRFAPRCRYAQPECLAENPPLFSDEPGHEYRCFFPVGTSAGAEALERNERAGSTAAGTTMDLLTKASA